MSTFLQKHRNWVIALAVAVIAFMMSAYVVPEEEQVVIIRTGEPVGVVNTPNGSTNAGLYFRIPFIDSVNRIEKRLLDLEMTDEEVLSADQQRLLVNAYARFRITDPVRMVERAGSTDGVRNALEPILNSVLRQELGRRTFQAMLTAERSALNTVQHLSGIATMVAEYVRAMDNPDCTLLDTRKTIPGLRQLEKYAVRMGGGSNHRMGLWDAAMIKDNHVLVAGSVGEAVRRAVAAGVSDIICEVDRIDQIEPALAAGATRLLLDNMEPDTLREAVGIVAGRVPTEASGGINLDTINAKATTGVDFVSVGRLTQSAPAADIGLDFTTLD